MNTIFIGIAGGTGSGKTTLTEHLKQHFGDDISVVHHDSYYKYQDRPFEERCKQNYDHPDAFETDLMVEQLKELKAGKAILGPLGAALPRCCRLIAPLHEPELGACLILQKRLGLSL